MKRTYCIWFVLALLVATLIGCESAQESHNGNGEVIYNPEIKGLYYQLSADGTCYYIMGGNIGEDTELIIPEQWQGLPVAGIYLDSHFGGNLKSVTIPNSVIWIAEGVFSGCTSLEKIMVSPTNPVYHSDGDCLIETKTKTLIAGCKNSVIPVDRSVIKIGKRAFYNRIDLEHITIPGSVTVIEENAFGNCPGLESITVELDNSTYHSENNCLIDTKMKTLIAGCKNSVIPSDGSITSIGEGAFYGCTSLERITIPDSVSVIGPYAFSDCANLIGVTIPDSVSSMGKDVFFGCQKLETIFCGAEGTPDGWESDWFGNAIVYWGWKSDYSAGQPSSGLEYALSEDKKSYIVTGIGTCQDTKIMIPGKYNDLPVVGIGESAFENCTSLTSIAIPNSITNIKGSAFRYCTSLQRITLPEGVTGISFVVFDGCTNLRSVTIPNSVTYICNSFGDCTSLQSITIPGSVTRVDYDAFRNCSGLESITVLPDNPNYHSDGNCLIDTKTKTLVAGCKNSVIPTDGSVTSIGDGAFEGRTSLEQITIPNSVTHIGMYAFNDCTSLEQITIPNSVTHIGKSAFSGCTSLERITIPDSVTCISEYLFFSCENLKNVTLSDGIISICTQAFYGCTSLESITIPGSVTKIGESAFTDCTSLTSVIIPNSVTYIEEFVFGRCTNLKTIYCEAESKPAGWAERWHRSPFTNIYWGGEWEYVNGVPTVR